MDEIRRVTVQRANVILEIPEYQLDYYMSQGYNQIDAYGNVINASVPTNVGTLQKAYLDHTNEIESLKEEIERLKEELAKTKKRGKK